MDVKIKMFLAIFVSHRNKQELQQIESNRIVLLKGDIYYLIETGK
jgi:hypothetical protein